MTGKSIETGEIRYRFANPNGPGRRASGDRPPSTLERDREYGGGASNVALTDELAYCLRTLRNIAYPGRQGPAQVEKVLKKYDAWKANRI